MKRISVLLFSLLLCGQSFCINQIPDDSLSIKVLSEKIDKLNTDFLLLKTENEILQKANDRISTSVYFTVGIILASFFGLGIFNYYQGNKLNTQKMENLIQASKTSIIETLPDTISNLFSKEIAVLKSMSRDANRVIQDILEDILILKIPSHPFHNFESSINNTIELLNLQIMAKSPFLDPTLQSLIIELKSKDNYLHYDRKNRLLQLMNNELQDKYQNQAREIIELIKNRVD